MFQKLFEISSIILVLSTAISGDDLSCYFCIDTAQTLDKAERACRYWSGGSDIQTAMCYKTPTACGISVIKETYLEKKTFQYIKIKTCAERNADYCDQKEKEIQTRTEEDPSIEVELVQCYSCNESYCNGATKFGITNFVLFSISSLITYNNW